MDEGGALFTKYFARISACTVYIICICNRTSATMAGSASVHDCDQILATIARIIQSVTQTVGERNSLSHNIHIRRLQDCRHNLGEYKVACPSPNTHG